MSEKNVNLIRPGETYVGAQGVTYSAGVSRNTAGSEKVCMNVLPMAPGVHSIPHIHKEIETIAYLLDNVPASELASWDTPSIGQPSPKNTRVW